MNRIEENGLIRYESEALHSLGVKHGFFTRLGGVSKPPFDSLNVKFQTDDDPIAVNENRQRILTTLQTRVMYFAKLEHGSKWQEVTEIEPGNHDVKEVDCLITAEARVGLGLSVADCLPIIVSDGNVLAVIHAGWRGTVLRITETVVMELIRKGLNTEKTVAATGPCICKKHFEVRDEAAQKLRQLAGEEASDKPYHADLEALNIEQLKQAGVQTIDSLSICSFESDEFYSYRREGGKTGRNMAIALLS